jgi:hypothetical protein
MADNAAAQSISVQSVTRMLVKTYDLAMAEKQASAAAQAALGVAKLHGLLIDRVQADLLIRKPSASPDGPDEMDADEWLSSYAGPTITLPTIAPPSSSSSSSKKN